jgi:hypothetical protein
MAGLYLLLLVPCLEYGVSFGNMPIEEFAYRFCAPLVLVGPERSDQYFLNAPAGLLDKTIDLMLDSWTPVAKPTGFQELPVI